MAGLVKPQDYDWKDSNVEKIGSDEDREVKKESALTEKCWEPVGKATNPFLMVWRIKQFELVVVPTDEIGNFYNGDSYIVCKATKMPGGDKLLYNIHFWIGRHSTADEYGTAAYKTVELDTFLDDAAIQHREVEGYESDLFKTYFAKLVILKGGFESGFRHVKPEEYRPRLLHFCKEGKTTFMRQVAYSKQSIDFGDVYILDLGKTAYQFNGSKSSPFERNAAAAFLQDLEGKRNGRCTTFVLDESNTPKDHIFWTTLPDTPLEEPETPKDVIKSLYKMSDATGKLELTIVSEGRAAKSDIKPDDVYMILSPKGLFVHIGRDCSVVEKRNALSNAHKFLQTSPNPLLPITVVTEEQATAFLTGIWDE